MSGKDKAAVRARIDAGKNLGAGTFFSGLIDDVRIYNVALNAVKIEAFAR